ncbi:hypothetical protein ACGFIF_35970 [Kribbella sp. NPDC049174]|uniref:hypothetical protein n=1 Tax=Kribbella sp. NPDC049174 TaxID=3364112 RepID=UPI0037236384
MTANDLKHLLQTVATQGTDNVELDELSLLPRIRRRRRRRTVLTGVTGLATAAVVAVSAYAVLPGAETTEVAEPGPVVVTTSPVPPVRCGADVPASGTGTTLRQLMQKTIAQSPDGWSGTVQIVQTNVLNSTLIIGPPPRDLVVVQANKIVGHAVLASAVGTVKIPPKQMHTSSAGIDIRSCGGTRLAAGSYLVYEDLAGGAVSKVPLGRIELT